MGLSEEELRDHCETILKSRRIRGKIVVLCEGQITRVGGRLSPQSYGKMEQMPDANFYRNCVPRDWSQKIPEFFNCGDRVDVIDTYFRLKELNKDSTDFYLDSNRLFAILDLDLQRKDINYSYLFPSTEDIYADLYQDRKVNQANATNHRIWVTGFLHKESYFFIPELQETFDNHSVIPLYKDKKILLDTIYRNICNDLINDKNIKRNLATACQRICHCSELDTVSVDSIQKSWLKAFDIANESKRKELILALLMIRKVKDYWNQIKPDDTWSGSLNNFKDQLLLAISRFYSQHPEAREYHWPDFFSVLKQFV